MGTRPSRSAAILLECSVALVVIGVLAVIVAQALVWSWRERTRLATHHAALELAANVLEAARAQPWEQLDKNGADSQTIPSDMGGLLPAGQLLVKLEAGQPVAQTRRVTVEVRWQLEPSLPPRSVQLTTILSGRETKKNGGQP